MMVFPQLKNYQDVYFSIELTYAPLCYFFPRYLAYTWLSVCSYKAATTNIPFVQAVYFQVCKTKSLLSETV